MDKFNFNQIIEIARVLNRKKIQDFSDNELTEFFPKLTNVRAFLFYSGDPGFNMMDYYYLRLLEEFRKRKIVPPIVNIAYDKEGDIIFGIEILDVACSILPFDDMYELIDTIISYLEQDLDENSAGKAREIIIKIAEKYV